MMARPTKLTPETSGAIVKALAIGATRKDAAGAAGVDYTTFLNWMASGEKARSGQFFEFFNACRRAEHDARLRYTSVIAKAAQEGDWRAALEYLKRRDRENWGDNVSTTAAVKVEVVEGFDYAVALAPLAPRPIQDSDTPSQD